MKDRISEFMDGELDDRAAGGVIEALGRDDEARDAWRTYHLIGDTLRDSALLSAGFSVRAEWEMPAPRGRLDVAAFPREEILAATGLDVARLAARLRPMFETRFARRSVTVSIDGATQAEIAVDLGVYDRELADRIGHSLEDERHIGELRAVASLKLCLVLFSELVHAGHIDLVHTGHVGRGLF